MLSYIIRRLLMLPIVVFGCILLVYTVMQFMTPYQRVSVFISSPNELKNTNIDELVEDYGLNDPAWQQFARWIATMFRGEFGYSQAAQRTVANAFARFVPVSAELALWSVVPVILGGILLGSASAVRHNKLFDHVMRVVAIIGWSLPTFVAGLLGLFLFYGILEWFPPGQIGIEASAMMRAPEFIHYTRLITVDAILNWNWFVFLDALRHLILPVFVLSFVSWAMLLRIMRTSMLEVLRQDYITTARSKGLSERVVIKKHARRNALIPPLTVAGLTIAFMFSGMVITETIFDWHGIGRWAARAAQTFDMPALLAFMLFNGSLIVIANLIVDIMYAKLDPRVRLQ
jgi:ABC-type dipeptide/oligopeptide/nickel transport system permease component